MSNSERPHTRQPTRLPCPWDSPVRNTGVGCHCLLQCMKVKSESEVAQSYPTLSDPVDCSLPDSSIHGIFQARVLEWDAIAFSVLCYNQCQNRHPFIDTFAYLPNYLLWLNPASGIVDKSIYFLKTLDADHQTTLQKECTTQLPASSLSKIALEVTVPCFFHCY